MQSLLSAEFETRGWQWDLTTGREIVMEIERRGRVEPEHLAKLASSDWLARNGLTRAELSEAVADALGDVAPEAPTAPGVTTIVVGGTHYDLSGSTFSGGNVNVGGTQINVGTNSDPATLLDAVAALVRAGIAGDWNGDAATALAGELAGRDDIGIEDVQNKAAEIVREEQPKQGAVKGFLAKIAASGLGGALATGISAGAGEVISQLPM